MTILEDCGCFSDTDLGVMWPCCLHRGQTEAMRQADEQQHVEEAAAFNGWIDGDRS